MYDFWDFKECIYFLLFFGRDDDADECSSQVKQQVDSQQSLSGSNPFLDVPNAATAVEYKKGYVMRKSCIDPNGKKSKLIK